MRTRVVVLVFLLSACAGIAAGEAPLPDPRDPAVRPEDRLEALLERIRHEHSLLRTLEADFVQRKESEMLLAPSEALGTFSYSAPDRVRWEYRDPDPITLLIDGDQMTTWYRDLGQAERMQVGRQSQKVLEYLGAGSSLENLLEYFDCRLAAPKDEELPLRLELTPRFERVAKRLREMTLWIDSRSFLPIGLRYVEPDGDVTEYRFQNLRVNGELPADLFRLDLPAGTTLREVELGGRSALR